MTDKVKKQNEELERLLADPSTPADVLIATTEKLCELIKEGK